METVQTSRAPAVQKEDKECCVFIFVYETLALHMT